MTNKKLIDLESLNKFAKDFNNEIDKKFNAELEIKADKSELFSGDYSDLTNKPFYDSREYEDVVIEYDGNNEGRTMCSLPTLGLSTAYKVADLTAEQLELYSSSCANGFTLTYLKEDGSTEVVQSSTVYGFMEGSKYLDARGGQVFLAVEPFSTEIGHANNYVNEAGIYFKENTGTNPYKVVKLEFQNVSGEVKTIEPQFLTNSPGIKVEEGKSYISEYNSQTYVAQNNAEIFNDTRNMATGQYSHAEGAMTEAHGNYSHAEGYYTRAIGDYSHAEGGFAKAIGEYSHAEGNRTLAEGSDSHAEGSSNKAIGYCSHAEGSDNKATGECSHAEGYKTTAAGKWQHVQGVYNIEDTENKYAHIVGNGDYMYGGSGPSNAHTLDWDGNAWFAGKVTASVQPTDNNDLTTKEYVDNSIAEIVNSAPETLNTLNELAQALGDDPNFATTMATEIGKKADKNDLFSKDYNDLTNKPEIPSIEGLATEEFVNNLNNDVVENINEINTELETKASTEFVNATLDGLRLLQITKEDYDALETKDPSTLYVVI